MSILINPRQIIKDGITSLRDVWSSSKVSTELSGKQATLVSGTNIKTINNTSLLGSGDIPISGGGDIPKINMTATIATLDPNKFYVWGEVASLDISLAAETAGIENVYKFQFQSGTTATTLTLPNDIKWDSAYTPLFDALETKYIVTILSNIAKIERYYTDTLLPPEYQQVEYLATNGTTDCWIDTGYLASSDYSFEVGVKFDSNNHGGVAGYILNPNTWGEGYAAIASSNNVGFIRLLSKNQVSNYSFDSQRHIIGCYPDRLVFDNITYTFSQQSFSYSYNIYLFATWQQAYNPSYTISSCEIDYFILRRVVDGEVLLHYIPCYRKSDNMAGMYDIVSDVFVTNASSGSFIVGPDV